ncbi:hypothetical protein PA86_03369 [Pseudomonas aeruginosa]|nr:hypothetical protein CKAES1M_03755 [Pseudomonas aeruginosa]QBN04492.1 hypothetical protein CKAES1R_01972 [Pseudomonas aeruginosa]RCL96758.1 hypothetical protein PA66_02515 [Pseudomonas aeruginosa]RCM03322.1 hypothetical protein PA86_03369 [Pseudomonas aeruginosa]RCM27573.1 hypothetical protein PA59_03270 [Pseudomonas aeruginosa]
MTAKQRAKGFLVWTLIWASVLVASAIQYS